MAVRTPPTATEGTTRTKAGGATSHAYKGILAGTEVADGPIKEPDMNMRVQLKKLISNFVMTMGCLGLIACAPDDELGVVGQILVDMDVASLPLNEVMSARRARWALARRRARRDALASSHRLSVSGEERDIPADIDVVIDMISLMPV